MMKHEHQIITVRENGTIDCAVLNEEPSMAQQHHKDDCDINNIMRKYETTGQFTGHIREGGMYADFSQITDLQDMIDTVKYAQDAFMTLPAHVRKQFDNDPQLLLNFIQDPKNYDEGVKLGLIDPQIRQNKMGNQNATNEPNEQREKPKQQQSQKQQPIQTKLDDSKES